MRSTALIRFLRRDVFFCSRPQQEYSLGVLLGSRCLPATGEFITAWLGFQRRLRPGSLARLSSRVCLHVCIHGTTSEKSILSPSCHARLHLQVHGYKFEGNYTFSSVLIYFLRTFPENPEEIPVSHQQGKARRARETSPSGKPLKGAPPPAPATHRNQEK